MDYTSNLQDYQIPVNAFKGFYQIELEKYWSINYIPLRNWYNPLKTKTLKYHFLGDIINKLDLINFIGHIDHKLNTLILKLCHG
jgi:hypothetical protein